MPWPISYYANITPKLHLSLSLSPLFLCIFDPFRSNSDAADLAVFRNVRHKEQRIPFLSRIGRRNGASKDIEYPGLHEYMHLSILESENSRLQVVH